MTFGEAVNSFFTNYTNFSARSRRAELWWIVLFMFLAGFATGAADFAFGMVGIPPLVTPLFFLGTLVPNFALMARRLHDTGRSGWWLLLYYIPFVGWIFFLIFNLQGSDMSNRWGTPADRG